MNDLLDEVKEDIREERHRYIVHKFTKFFSICAILVIIGVSIYTWKEHVANKLQHNLGLWFSQATTAIEQNQPNEAIIYLDKIIEYPHQQYAALAYLNKVAILLKQNKIGEAENILLKMADQKHFNTSLRELAQVIYLSNKLANNEADINEATEILTKLSKENKPWQLSALQLKALHDIKLNKINDAKATLNQIITSKQANYSSKDTASSILSVISRTQ